MLGRKSRPAIGNLITGDRSGLMDLATSPRSPLEFKIRSPRNLINYDAGKVGLGIVATLGGGETPAGKPLYGRNMSRSDPIPVKTAKNSGGIRGGFEEMEMDSLEEYTFVTCHGPEKSYTRVYGKNGHERDGFDRRLVSGKPKSSRGGCVFDISPARLGDFPAYPSADFLSSCDLCRKKLHGKDIYMYRGERAFCSTECRYRQIAMDERKEKCRYEASRSSSSAAVAAAADVSSNSPYTNGHQFLRGGILAI